MGWILFFDGDCAFCSKTVRQVAVLDQRGNVRFAPLQGKLSNEMGLAKHASEDGGTMVVLRESDGKLFLHSDGWIELVRALGGWWRVLAVFAILPHWIRDGAYRWIARNRYRFFGKRNSCEMPDPELQKRLLE